MSHLTVSVLIATYNRADLLPDALNSVFAQTRVPDEIIVVDDGSTDNTSEVLSGYGSKIKVIHQENKGLPTARNVGMRAATCDLIAFLDSDDTLPPKSIARRAEFLEENSSLKAVYGAAYMTDMHEKILGWFRVPPLPEGNIFFESVCRTVFPMHTVMFHKECIEAVGYFDEELRVQLDFDYWIRFSALYTFGAINEPLAYYRVHDGMSIVTQSDDIIQKGILVQRRIFNTPAFTRLSPTQKARVYSVHATQHMLIDDTSNARHWYWQAIRCAPWLPRPYLLLGLTLFGKRGLDAVGGMWRRLHGERIAK